jgi:REP element-mobilizing transposase RayT
MARPSRFEAPGATHHVVAKGVAQTSVVRDDHDRRALWIRLARTVERYEWRCSAYCFLDTHLHLVVTTPQPNLGAGMQWLCGRYAQEFNARWGRSGHLFGGRFYSGRIVSDEHLVSAVVYVLLNPVRAGIVSRPELWSWSSYGATVGLVDPPAFLDVAAVLELVDGRREHAQRLLAAAALEAVDALPRLVT